MRLLGSLISNRQLASSLLGGVSPDFACRSNTSKKLDALSFSTIPVS